LLPTWFLPHYVAPITCAILALVLQAMRRIRSHPAGLFVTRAVPLACTLLLVVQVGAKPLHVAPCHGATWCGRTPSNLERAAVLTKLQHVPGLQLAIVRYARNHDVQYNEWVYNEADIDRAKVVWARDMGPAENQELLDYFRDRHVWVIDADDPEPILAPYTAHQ